MDLAPLYDRAFLTAPAPQANGTLDEARSRIQGESRARAFGYEVVVPEGADDAWFEERFVRRLVYHCESAKAPLPACPGVFVALFVGMTLHCVRAADVVAFACDALGATPAELVRRFGTGEIKSPLPPAGEA